MELNVQIEHVHLVVKVPSKLSVSKLTGVLKGRTVARVFNVFSQMQKKLYRGNHFWANGYCVDTILLDGEMIKTYLKFQEKEESHQQELQLK